MNDIRQDGALGGGDLDWVGRRVAFDFAGAETDVQRNRRMLGLD